MFVNDSSTDCTFYLAIFICRTQIKELETGFIEIE